MIDEPSEKLLKVRNQTTTIIAIGLFVLNFPVLFINLYLHSSSIINSVLVFIFASLLFISQRIEKEEIAELILIYGGLFLVFFMSYQTSSAMLFMLAGLIILLTTVFDYNYATEISTLLTYVTMTFFVLIKKFTLQQVVIQGVGLSNNIQVPFLFITATYVLAVLFRNTFIATIHSQSRKYDALQESQKMLLSKAKLDTVKVLASGLSHDFNNLLTFIMGKIQINLLDKSLTDPQRSNMLDMEQAVLKASNLSGQMLSLVKDDVSILDDIPNFENLITSTVNFSLKGAQTVVHFDIQDLWIVVGDPMQISQVIQNLVINAYQAMDNQGVLNVKARNVILTKNNEFKLSEGNYVEVHIIDDGPGVPEHLQDVIFELLKTSKKNASGLGLAISKQIIEHHQGYIGFVTSSTGTDFFFLLPAYEDTIGDLISGNIERKQQFSGNVLIYDDNVDVLKILVAMLRKLGMTAYEVSESKSFLQLIDTFQEKNKHIDIFILDLVLPGDIPGVKMVELIKERVEDPYIVVSSGYSHEFVFSEYKRYLFNGILRKPYQMSDLVDVLEEYYKYKKSK